MTLIIGRLLQLVGMILLPYGLFIGIFGDNLRLEVNLLFIGGTVFVLGWLMAKNPKSKIQNPK